MPAKPLEGRHVAVLLGGLSSEREVSLVSGRECADALERLGAKVTRIDAGRDLAEVLARLKPTWCSTSCTASWGEDGCVQGILETLQIPYTHSGVLASALAMDKAKAKAVLRGRRRRRAGRRAVQPLRGGARPRHGAALCGEAERRGLVGRRLPACSRAPTAPPQEVVAPDWTFGEEVMVEPYVARQGAGRGGARTTARLTVTEIVPHDRLLRLRGQVRRGRLEPRRARADAASTRSRRRCARPSSRTPRWVAAGLPAATSVMTILRTFWSFWRSTPSPA